NNIRGGTSLDKKIILFDGICTFCNRSVQFIIHHDPHEHFQFASLQSDIGQSLLKKYSIHLSEDSLDLINQNSYDNKSKAALNITRYLNGLLPLLYIFIIVPRPIRNLVYRYIANNRYKWFGKQTACKIPTTKEKKRFL